MSLITDFGGLDIFFELKNTAGFERLRESADVMPIFDDEVWVASIDDLITMKRADNCLYDANHILELLEIQKLLREESAVYSVSPSE